MGDIQFGGIALSAILAAILALLYRATGDSIPDRFRALIAAVCGIGFGILAIPYNGLQWTTVVVVDNIIKGLMIGLSATGIYETQRTITNPR